MSIPLVSNLAFTEVDSAGTLNDKAGTAKSKLPIQFFKLTDNISGNLTLSNDSAHKKIILDTNGNTITNSSGSPLTTNSSTTLELKGSGNIQSTLKTFTSSVASTSNTGTTVVSNSDSSTVVVSAVDRTADISLSGGVSVASGFGGSFSTSNVIYLPNSELITHPSNPGSNSGSLSSAASAAATVMFNMVGGGNMPNVQSGAGFSVTISHSGTTTTHTAPTSTSGTPNNSGYRVNFDNGGGKGVAFVYRGGTDIRCSSISDPSTSGIAGPSVSAMKIPNNTVSDGGRTIAFTNNLAISVVLTGADPYDSVTVAAGATNTVTRTTTDGSFSLTGTISGSDGSSQPFALIASNNGTGSVNTDAYTGTLSASAL